ncbi:MAG: hypothetical protein J6X45_04340 [Lachnospiraceae bacterium]|nr:hypothetical protein [Lachnospiraceae bacterium]
MPEIKKTGAAATSKSALNTKSGKISGGTTTTSQIGYGPIEQSTERYDPDIEDRKELGKTPLELYVDELPEDCEECIFYVKNSNYDKVSEGESVFYCQLRSLNSTAQYGGYNIMEPKTWKCPLVPIYECERLLNMRNNHLTRIRELERKVFGSDKGTNDGFL